MFSIYSLEGGGGQRLKIDFTSGWKLSWTLVSSETKDGDSTGNIVDRSLPACQFITDFFSTTKKVVCIDEILKDSQH